MRLKEIMPQAKIIKFLSRSYKLYLETEQNYSSISKTTLKTSFVFQNFIDFHRFPNLCKVDVPYEKKAD